MMPKSYQAKKKKSLKIFHKTSCDKIIFNGGTKVHKNIPLLKRIEKTAQDLFYTSDAIEDTQLYTLYHSNLVSQTFKKCLNINTHFNTNGQDGITVNQSS